jgi:outer membrane receptor protein involved in Fe transport
LLEDSRRVRLAGPSATIISGQEATTRVTSDAGSLIGKSAASAGVTVQRRTPIVTDPRVRGARVGQLVASGSYWVPARMDLDTMLSKIDSRLIADMLVVKGPYSSLYGPGWNFLDVELLKSPRFSNGFESHGSSSTDYQTNGEQLYGRQSLWGGDDRWGYRLGYGFRTGNDYETGSGAMLPASYKSGTLDATVGWDLSPDAHLDVSYLRLDQADVEFPGQIFDLNFLTTDAIEANLLLESLDWCDTVQGEVWYNRTQFAGDAQRSGKRRQNPFLSGPLGYVGSTDADTISTGYTLSARWGELDEAWLLAGADLRYLAQQLNELSTFNRFVPGLGIIRPTVNSPIPASHSANPGLFAELTRPVDERWTLHVGGRVDWASNDIDELPRKGATSLFTESELLTALATDRLQRDYVLWAGHVTADYQWDENWTTRGGVGYGERPPTLTELYAVSPFLAILQQGFTAVRGTPGLNPERNLQFDVGVEAEFEQFRGSLHGFQAFVFDYITYLPRHRQDVSVGDAINVAFANTDLATLTGGELAMEWDATAWLTPFASLNYVQGQDETRDTRGSLPLPDPPAGQEEPLPGIAPLDSRIGLRWHSTAEAPHWWIEFATRIVARQSRVASSLLERETSGFTTYDLRTVWKPEPGIQFVAGVENMFDRNYREHLDLRTGNGVFQPGRSVYVGSEITY